VLEHFKVFTFQCLCWEQLCRLSYASYALLIMLY